MVVVVGCRCCQGSQVDLCVSVTKLREPRNEGGGIVQGLPASANAAAGAFKEQEAPAV